jgi:hypothetical protein
VVGELKARDSTFTPTQKRAFPRPTYRRYRSVSNFTINLGT